ncbi:hypothetical protein [Desulfovibrio ferrophilus]|uniref:Uncharacterized protein n=1 Tax=Desulfovibrio ferrophilus TaxID=241368 RepID=A0A2Z6B2G5_9BACT|nr:hypothetical protein [Desulfovibrio ferrophilus]BBD09606.1 uncharacterized protein DFE_2880 [Desulfovibrio ferrophilus]
MANMDYPAPCFSCIESECFLPEDSINRNASSGKQPTPFWNHLSREENIVNVDTDAPWNIL